MKTSKHTAGPWVTGDDHPSVCRMTENGSQQICAMDIAGFEVGEPEANARLIAAAPELLAALQSMELDLEQLDSADLAPGHQATMTNLRSEVRAAIAKATEGTV